MAALSITQARAQFPDAINRVVYAGERVVLRRHNKDVAALISIRDLQLLEKLEDDLLVEEALEAERAAAAAGERPIPLAEVERRLDAARRTRARGGRSRSKR